MSALLVGGASTFVSCKDYDEDQTAVNNAELAKLQTSVKKNYDELKDAIETLENELEAAENKHDVDIQAIKERLKVLEDKLKNYDDVVSNASAGKSAWDWIQTYKNLETISGQAQAIADLVGAKQTLINLANMTNTWGEDFKNVVVYDELTKMLDGYVSSSDMLAYANLFEKREYMHKDVEHIVDSITNVNAENFTTFAELVASYDKVPARLQQISDSLKMMIGYMDNIQFTLDNMITGVNVDMVENPYFGTINTPFGIKSNVIVGFVGDQIENEDLAEFEGCTAYKDPKGYATSGNGGQIFFTINPNDIDATGLKFALVGRDGTEAPGFSFGTLAKDYTKVTTLSTRAAAVNGYVAPVVIEDGQAALVNVDKEELKKVAKNVLGKLKGQNSLNIMDAVKAIYNTAANAVPQYYALQAEYNVKDYEGNIVPKAYTSDYNIAAVTVKPLSYETLEGRGVTIPSIPQLQEILGIDLNNYRFEWDDIEHVADMTQSITLKIPNADDVTIDGSAINPKFEFDTSKLTVVPTIEKVYDDVTGEWTDIVVGNTEVAVHDGFVKIKDMDLGNARVAIGTKDTTITVTVSMKDFNTMIDNINGQVGGMLGKVDGIVNQIQGGFDKVNNGIIARLNSVIAKVNKITENPNALLQPVMFYSDANGAGRMSESDLAPTRFNLNGQTEGSIILAPTSYTAEMLAPAWIKDVKIIEGNGASVEKEGKLYKFTAKAGKYTIQYKSMDYYGKIRTKMYYVEVK